MAACMTSGREQLNSNASMPHLAAQRAASATVWPERSLDVESSALGSSCKVNEIHTGLPVAATAELTASASAIRLSVSPSQTST